MKETGINGDNWCPFGNPSETSIPVVIICLTMAWTIYFNLWGTLLIEAFLLIGPVFLWSDEKGII